MAVNSKRLVCSQPVLNQQEAIEQLIYQFTTYWRQIVQKYPEITSYLQNHITPLFSTAGGGVPVNFYYQKSPN